jgi:hypothetical protein
MSKDRFMFGLELLGVAIGMIFIYLLLSLLCTACGEIIEARLKRRSSDLARGIRELLRDPAGTGIAQDLYTHALVYGLYRGAYDSNRMKNLPSYIPAHTFALALMDVVWPVATRPPSTDRAAALASLKNEIGTLKNEHVKQALLPLIDAAGDNIEQERHGSYIRGVYEKHKMDHVCARLLGCGDPECRYHRNYTTYCQRLRRA